MKEIKHYNILTENLIERLNSRDFKFVTFSNIINNIELITIEKGSIIEGYGILEHSNNMNQDFYIDILSEMEDRYSDISIDNIISISNEDIYNQTIKQEIWDIEENIEILSFENTEESKIEITMLNKLKELLQDTSYLNYQENKDKIDYLKKSIRFYKNDSNILDLESLNDIRIKELELLNNTKEVLSILEEKDFYYISYLECIPSNNGNGTEIVKYIKENYKKTVLIPSGYAFKESSTDFWQKQGYKKAPLLMFNA